MGDCLLADKLSVYVTSHLGRLNPSPTGPDSLLMQFSHCVYHLLTYLFTGVGAPVKGNQSSGGWY